MVLRVRRRFETPEHVLNYPEPAQLRIVAPDDTIAPGLGARTEEQKLVAALNAIDVTLCACEIRTLEIPMVQRSIRPLAQQHHDHEGTHEHD